MILAADENVDENLLNKDPSMRSRTTPRTTAIAVALLVVVTACSADASTDTRQPATTSTSEAVGTTTTIESAPSATTGEVDGGIEERFASHLFVPVGSRRTIAGLGELIEVVDLDGPGAVSIDGTDVIAEHGGTACLRFRYRDTVGENQVQTMCIVVVDEEGTCEGFDPVRLDLDGFDPAGPSGDANLLEPGDLVSVCRTAAGSVRLSRAPSPPPTLYFMIVDALGGGAYSLGDDEFDRQRAGAVTTFGGGEVTPPWVVTVSREISTLEWGIDGSIQVNTEDCALVPSCTNDPDVVRTGDVFRTSLGLDPELLLELRDRATPDDLAEFVQSRIDVDWADIAAIHPDAVDRAFARLAVLEIKLDLLEEWDDVYGLRQRSIVVAYRQHWFVDQELTEFCFPDDAEQATCSRIEEAIADFEARRLGEARLSGLRLWQVGPIDTSGRLPLADRRPHWSMFEGVMAGIGDQDLEDADPGATYGMAVERLAAEIGPDHPVMLFLTGSPLAAQTTGEFCEAEVCVSDFSGALRMAEGALDAAMENFDSDQFVGFAVALFDGGHFDISSPIEDFGFRLNRVGETGYNHPILNVWRAAE